MGKIKNKFFKIFATILAACGISSCFIACCYGMPPGTNNHGVTFKVLGDVNNDGKVDDDEVVSGVYVRPVGEASDFDKNGTDATPIMDNSDWTECWGGTTDETGMTSFDFSAYEDVVFEACETEMFESQFVKVHFDDNYDTEFVTITLNRKTDSASDSDSESASDSTSNSTDAQ